MDATISMIRIHYTVNSNNQGTIRRVQAYSGLTTMVIHMFLFFII